jgi:comEA protein
MQLIPFQTRSFWTVLIPLITVMIEPTVFAAQTSAAHKEPSPSVDTQPCPPDTLWLDRWEMDIALLVDSDQSTWEVPKALLPEQASEGDAIHQGRRLPACNRWARRSVTQLLSRLASRTEHSGQGARASQKNEHPSPISSFSAMLFDSGMSGRDRIWSIPRLGQPGQEKASGKSSQNFANHWCHPRLLWVGHASADEKDGRININTADVGLLDTLPGIGPVKAKAIVDHRESHGPFKAVDSLIDVKGIGPKTMEKLRPLITVGKPASKGNPSPARK